MESKKIDMAPERRRLWEYRVRRNGGLQYCSLYMSQEEIAIRDRKIRSLLKGTKYEEFSKEALMEIRVCRIPETEGIKTPGLCIENEAGIEVFLPDAGVGKIHSEFLKRYSRIPFDYMGKMGKDFDWSIYGSENAQKVETVKGFVNQFIVKFERFLKEGLGIYIYSQTKGSGKTLLACILLNEITSRYAVGVKFITIKDYLDMTKDSYDGKKEEVDSISNVGLLVIDDIGLGLRKDWINTTFYNLINDRNNRRLVTIYTSNLPAGELNMDERIIDRIEGRSCLLHLPEIPVRHMRGEVEKERFLKELSE